MRITVDWGLCDSYALCAEIAPHVFEVGDDDVLRVLVEAPEPEDHALVEEAVSACPKQALRIVN